METLTLISDTLKSIQERNAFTDQQLAKHVGVSRWTIYRIFKGEIGETISTKLVDLALKERSQPVEQTA